MPQIKILIKGGYGRLGQAIFDEAQTQANKEIFNIAARLKREDQTKDYIKACEVVLDTSVHSTSVELASICAEFKKPLIIGCTGHTEEETDALCKFSETIPILVAYNFSIGMNLLYYLTKKSAHALGESFHPEVIDIHHAQKKDAPSGAATVLIKKIKEGREKPITSNNVLYGRKGFSKGRTFEEIGMHSLRGGDIVGEHSVLFLGSGERIELKHCATNRAIFAQGALLACKWIAAQKQARLYTMENVLDLEN